MSPGHVAVVPLHKSPEQQPLVAGPVHTHRQGERPPGAKLTRNMSGRQQAEVVVEHSVVMVGGFMGVRWMRRGRRRGRGRGRRRGGSPRALYEGEEHGLVGHAGRKVAEELALSRGRGGGGEGGRRGGGGLRHLVVLLDGQPLDVDLLHPLPHALLGGPALGQRHAPSGRALV